MIKAIIFLGIKVLKILEQDYKVTIYKGMKFDIVFVSGE